MTDNSKTPNEPQIATNVLPFSTSQNAFDGSAAINIVAEAGLDGLPAAYHLREDGVHEMRSSGEGDDIPVHICSPIFVRGLCSRTDGSCWGRVVDIQDPNGTMHRHIIDEGALSGGPAVLLRPLRALGLSAEPVDKAAQSVVKLLQSWRPAARFTRADVLGWTDNNFKAFTLGTGEVIGDARVVFQHQIGDVGDAMRARGSLEEWRQAIAAACAGNPLMVLAVSQAFTGPLLWPLAMDGGGFHLRGASSRGKSTLLGVAASVWGAPSFMQSWRATDNGIESIASACSSTLLVLDELYQVSPKSAGEIVYMLVLCHSQVPMRKGSRWPAL
jgi:putative DNA primase/helicase